MTYDERAWTTMIKPRDLPLRNLLPRRRSMDPVALPYTIPENADMITEWRNGVWMMLSAVLANAGELKLRMRERRKYAIVQKFTWIEM